MPASPPSQSPPPPTPHVVSIHIAPGSRLPMRSVERVRVEAGKGIVGDRYHGTRHRHVTVQSLRELAEAAERHGAPIDPALTRRNVTISDGVLPRTPGARLRIGTIELEVVRDAAPCKLLEDELGRDARKALSRRAGVVCRVLRGGELAVGAIFGCGVESDREPLVQAAGSTALEARSRSSVRPFPGAAF